jgi:hypothetical protein
MTAPHYISEDNSDMRGIKPGWYAIEDDDNLSSGPFSSLEECVKSITQPTNGTMRRVARRQAPWCAPRLGARFLDIGPVSSRC